MLSVDWFATNKWFPDGWITKFLGVDPLIDSCPSDASDPESGFISNPIIAGGLAFSGVMILEINKAGEFLYFQL